jgi:hypothetical protein
MDPEASTLVIVALAESPPVTDDRVVAANRASPRQEAQGNHPGSPRVAVVFRVRQCDKENHGWREGPPLVLPARIAPVTGLHPPGVFIVEEKENCFSRLAAPLYGLAGIKGLPARERSFGG